MYVGWSCFVDIRMAILELKYIDEKYADGFSDLFQYVEGHVLVIYLFELYVLIIGEPIFADSFAKHKRFLVPKLHYSTLPVFKWWS